MFRKAVTPIVFNDGKSIIPHDTQFEYATSYLARTRRILFLRGVIIGWPGGLVGRNDEHASSQIIDDILAMNVESDDPIYLVIDSVGGLTDAGLMLYDIIRMSRAPIITIGYNCASMATILLAAGKERLALPHSRFMLHLPSGGFNGEVKEAELRTREMVKTMHTLVDCYIECGVTAGVDVGSITKIRKQILKDIDREFWIGAKEAITYGLIDRIATTDELFGLPSLPTYAIPYDVNTTNAKSNVRIGSVYS